MDFSNYPAFQTRFQDSYGWLERDYPFALMVLESELRNLLSGEDETARRNISRLTEHYFPIDLLLRQVSHRRSADSQIYLEMPGFERTRQELAARFRQEGYGIFSDRRFFRTGANKVLHKMTTMGRAFPDAMKLADRAGMEALLNDRAALSRLDSAIEGNYRRVKDFLRAQKIALCVATGDSKPFSRIIIKAANELRIPYIVMVHGYVSEPLLVTIAPIRADKLIVWSQRQQQLLQKVLPARRDDIVTFGFPPRVSLSGDISPERRILFAWEPLERQSLKEPHLKVLGPMARACLRDGITPVFRPHPKERWMQDLMHELTDLGFQIDSDDLGTALSRAGCVVSSNSTVLSEAAAAGKPACQVAELAAFDFEGARMVTAKQFDPKALLSEDIRESAIPPLDEQALYKAIRAALPPRSGA